MKTLIAYSSTHGAAAECARRLAERFGGAETADLKKGTADPAAFDRVVLGSSIYGGQVQREVKEYCRRYLGVLLQKPLGIYFSCMTEEDAEARAYLQKAFPPELIPHLSAFGALGGAFYFTKLNFLERGVTKALLRQISKSKGTALPCDGKTDYVTLSDEKIGAFVRRMEAGLPEAAEGADDGD